MGIGSHTYFEQYKANADCRSINATTVESAKTGLVALDDGYESRSKETTLVPSKSSTTSDGQSVSKPVGMPELVLG